MKKVIILFLLMSFWCTGVSDGIHYYEIIDFNKFNQIERVALKSFIAGYHYARAGLSEEKSVEEFIEKVFDN